MAQIPFKANSSMAIIGPTGCGKTSWVYKFLCCLDQMYDPEPPTAIMYCYGIHQPLYDDMQERISNLIFHQGLPSQCDIDQFATGDHRLIILDDLMQQVLESNDMELLFVQGCHHRRLSVLFISQNLYGQGKAARTIALNCWYMVLFRTMRGISQIVTLSRQLYAGKSNTLMEAYQDATQEVFGYLIVDTSPYGKDSERLRTNIFPGEDTIIYIGKNA